jgi:uncharacterized protein
MNNSVMTPAQLRTRLQIFKKSHAQKYSLLSLGYFGSFARNEITSESDVDIVFDTSAPNLFRAVMLQQDLEELLGRSVDVLQLSGLSNPCLKSRIEKEVIYV